MRIAGPHHLTKNYFELSEYLIADFEKAQKKDHRDLDLVKNLEKNLLNKTMKILEDFLNNEVK